MIIPIIIKPKTPPPIAKIKVEGSDGAEGNGVGPGPGAGPGAGPGGVGAGVGPGGVGAGVGPGGLGVGHGIAELPRHSIFDLISPDPGPLIGKFLHPQVFIGPDGSDVTQN